MKTKIKPKGIVVLIRFAIPNKNLKNFIRKLKPSKNYIVDSVVDTMTK